MENEPLWLTRADVASIHAGQLERFGGAAGVGAMIEFLAINSIDLDVPESGDDAVPYLASLIIAAIERTLSETALTELLRRWACLRP